MGKLHFISSDFALGLSVTDEDAAEQANAALERMLAEQGVVVYGQGIGPMKSAEWLMNGPDFERYKHTHRALLVNIEPLHREPCKHEAESKIMKVDENGNISLKDFTCKHCGIKLDIVFVEVGKS